MLEPIIASLVDTARQKVPRGSRTWRVLAKLWTVWLRCEAVYRRNPLIKRRWARREAEFDHALRQLSARTDRFFVIQIGACDGVMADPIHPWIKRYKWHGILVEPQRAEFERLKATYRDECERLIFENVAIAAADGMCTLYRVREGLLSGDWERGVASLIPQADSERFMTETVPCVAFETLLKRHHVSHVDLLQIDVEGYDFEIVKQIDFQRIRPAMLRYEHRHLRPGDKRACHGYLEHNGYRVLEMKFDTGAISKDILA